MTVLIERFSISITINHDAEGADSTVYSGGTDLREKARSYLPLIVDAADFAPGKASIRNGAIEFEWSATGLEEVPELSGGDN